MGDEDERLSRRAEYEQEVRDLAHEAEQCRLAGESAEVIARALVKARNAIKARYRAGDDPVIVRLLEARNRKKYRDPLGPDADTLLGRYGTWEAVIAAACRPARLADG